MPPREVTLFWKIPPLAAIRVLLALARAGEERGVNVRSTCLCFCLYCKFFGPLGVITGKLSDGHPNSAKARTNSSAAPLRRAEGCSEQ
jgi:hypothetical protein